MMDDDDIFGSHNQNYLNTNSSDNFKLIFHAIDLIGQTY